MVSFHLIKRHFFSLALAALIGLMMPSFAVAADVAHGEQLFFANCAACHMGGGNVVNGQRTLKQDDLKAYLSDYNDGLESSNSLTQNLSSFSSTPHGAGAFSWQKEV